MHDHDDEFEFWHDASARQLERLDTGRRPATRRHGDTGQVPIVAGDAPRSPARWVDPRQARIGALVLVGAVLLGVAMTAGASGAPIGGRLAESAGVTAAPVTAAPVIEALGIAPPDATMPSTAVGPALGDPPSAPERALAASAAKADASPEKAAALVARPTCAHSYAVGRGDYWSGIAQRVQVTMRALLAANGATSRTVLYPGRSICLPSTSKVPAATERTPAAKNPTAPTTTATTTTSSTPNAPTPASKPRTATPTQVTQQQATATTAPAPTIPQRAYSRAEVAQIIRDIWPDDQEDKAIAIATRESNLQPTARNFCCYGLFQIYYGAHSSWLAASGVTSANQLLDPKVNALIALSLYNQSGWGPWGG